MFPVELTSRKQWLVPAPKECRSLLFRKKSNISSNKLNLFLKKTFIKFHCLLKLAKHHFTNLINTGLDIKSSHPEKENSLETNKENKFSARVAFN